MKKAFGCLAATLALAGAGLLGTTSAAAAQTGSTTPAKDAGQAQPADVPAVCDAGVITDWHDSEPKMYGSSWITCDYQSKITLQVTLYKDGREVSRDLCSVDGFTCTAATSVNNPAGKQRWKACVALHALPAGGAEWNHEECTKDVYN